jgi:hypothetical protein
MESVYHFVTIRVNVTSWAHVWRLRSRYLGMGYDTCSPLPPLFYSALLAQGRASPCAGLG